VRRKNDKRLVYTDKKKITDPYEVVESHGSLLNERRFTQNGRPYGQQARYIPDITSWYKRKNMPNYLLSRGNDSIGYLGKLSGDLPPSHKVRIKKR